MVSLIGRSSARTPSFLALMLITGTTALSTDTYIAALPQMQADLGTSTVVAQLTMTSCIAGMALGQLITGPVSDARGRRGLVIASTVVFMVMSVVCALSVNGWLLVAVRLVQGAAAGGGAAVGRAIVTDTFAGRDAAAKFGTLTAVSLVAPVVGPAIGGALLTVGTWRTIFWFLAGVGVLMTLAAAWGLPETLPPPLRHPGGLRNLMLRSRLLLSDPEFRTPVIVQCLTVGGFFIYIGGSSFVLQHGLGISEQVYTAVFAVNAGVMMASSVLFRLLVMRLGPVVLRGIAVIVQTLAVGALFTAATVAPDHRPALPVVWVCLSGMTLGLGTYLPANSSIVQLVGRRFGGTASALGGGIPFLVGAAMTPLTGVIGHQTVHAMAGAMVVFFALAAAASGLTYRRSGRPGSAHGSGMW
ncbi:MAG: MFS transporter [Propionibacterium sp.]|nr:MFS transporter [Propionibacterium sp.]